MSRPFALTTITTGTPPVTRCGIGTTKARRRRVLQQHVLERIEHRPAEKIEETVSVAREDVARLQPTVDEALPVDVGHAVVAGRHTGITDCTAGPSTRKSLA